MTGHECCRLRQTEFALLIQHADDRHADGHQGRLRVFGELQIVRRSFEHQTRQILTERVVGFLKNLFGFGEGGGQRLAHADGLASLARKEEGAVHDVQSFSILRHFPALCLPACQMRGKRLYI